MFEDVAAADLLCAVLCHDVDELPTLEAGFHRVEMVTACDRVIRAAQATGEARARTAHLDHPHRT